MPIDARAIKWDDAAPDSNAIQWDAPAVSPTDYQSVTPRRNQSNAWGEASKADILAGLPVTRAVTGVARPIIGLAQLGVGIAEKFGLSFEIGEAIAGHVMTLQEMQKRGMKALGESEHDIAGMAASMALPGVGLAGRVAPAASLGGKIIQGAALGGATGLTTPSTVPGIEAQLGQGAVGAAIGGAIPLSGAVLSKTGKALYRAAWEPLTAKGQAAIKSRTLLEAAGDKAPEVINALRTSRPAIPGSLPTAGEAAIPAGRAEFSALQASGERVLPSKYLARADARNAARIAGLEASLGDEAKLLADSATRRANATINYGAAEAAGIDPQMAAAIQPQIDSLLRRDSIKEAQRIAAGLAREKELTLTNMGSLEGLQWTQRGLKDMITSAQKSGTSVGAERLKALLQTKADLDATIEQIAPLMGTARKAYAVDSAPINQNEVGRYLKAKLTSAADETAPQRAGVFAGAVRDAPGTIKRSLTGAPRYEKLLDVLTPQQVATVEGIRQDLANIARQELMAQKGATVGPSAMDTVSSSVQQVSGGKTIPNPLSRVVTISNAILNRLEGKINKKLAIELADEMLNPQATARSLQRALLVDTKAKAKEQLTNNLRPVVISGVVQNALTPSPTRIELNNMASNRK